MNTQHKFKYTYKAEAAYARQMGKDPDDVRMKFTKYVLFGVLSEEEQKEALAKLPKINTADLQEIAFLCTYHQNKNLKVEDVEIPFNSNERVMFMEELKAAVADNFLLRVPDELKNPTETKDGQESS
jgi:hypothetical protein